jgi:two-component system OmpR family sensor kinase
VGRLFWKVFVFTMLAQLIATIGIGGAVWLKNRSHSTQEEQIDLSPPAAFMIESAASTLQYGGAPALRILLENMNHRRLIFAVDDENLELLGRTLSLQVLNEARGMVKQDAHRRVVRQVSAPDGHRYILFSPASPHDGDRDDAGEHRLPPRDGIMSNEERHPPSDDGSGFGQRPPPPPHGEHFLPFLPIGSAVLGSLIFALLLAWYFSKPIHSLRSAFDAVAAGDLDVHLGSAMGQRRDELADLGRDFDSMVDRLRALMDGQRRLLHDVSHELRSPLARLQAAIGLARQQPEKMEISLDRIERESVRMDKLIGELLTLSKLEAGALKPLQEDVRMAELIADLVYDARFEAEATGRKLEFNGECAVILKGDAELLHRALENVIRNALKQTIPGSTVMLEASLDVLHNELRLSVLDQGPGVPDAELTMIFEPFFRSVGTMQSIDGHGLGLAIAQRVVTTHRGSIRAFNREGGGLCVEICLPINRFDVRHGTNEIA